MHGPTCTCWAKLTPFLFKITELVTTKITELVTAKITELVTADITAAVTARVPALVLPEFAFDVERTVGPGSLPSTR